MFEEQPRSRAIELRGAFQLLDVVNHRGRLRDVVCGREGNLVVARAVFPAVHERQNAAAWPQRLMEVIVRAQKRAS